MRFTETEASAVVTEAVKEAIRTAVRGRLTRTDVDAAWDTMPTDRRGDVEAVLAEWVLPVLDGLPKVRVVAGKRPRFTVQQIWGSVSDVTVAEAAADGLARSDEDHGVVVEQRGDIVMIALNALPVLEADDDRVSSEEDVERARFSRLVPERVKEQNLRVLRGLSPAA